MRNKILLLALLLTSACSFTREAGDAWIVSIPPIESDTFKPASTGAPSLKILLPSAPDQLDTRRVALHRDDGALDYYDGMRWGDFLPLMLQSIVTRDLGASGAVGAVVPDSSPLPARNQLQLQVLKFSIWHEPDGIKAIIQLGYQLTNRGMIRDSGVVEGTQMLESETQAGIRGGFAGAYHQTLLQLVGVMNKARSRGLLLALDKPAIKAVAP